LKDDIYNHSTLVHHFILPFLIMSLPTNTGKCILYYTLHYYISRTYKK